MANIELGNRSKQAESIYNRRWLLGVTAGPLTVGLAAAVWMATVSGSLPGRLATRWGPDGVNGYSSLFAMVAIAVLAGGGSGALIAGVSVLTRDYSAVLARIGVGFGVAFGMLMTGLAVAVVAGQIGLADASRAEIDGPVMWASVLAGCVAGAACGGLYRPSETDRTPSADTVDAAATAANKDSAVAADARRSAANRDSLAIRVSMGQASWLLSLGIGAAVALSLVFIHPALGLLGLPAAALFWIFTSGKVVIDDAGVRVLAGGFWKLMRKPPGVPVPWSMRTGLVRGMNQCTWSLNCLGARPADGSGPGTGRRQR